MNERRAARAAHEAKLRINSILPSFALSPASAFVFFLIFLFSAVPLSWSQQKGISPELATQELLGCSNNLRIIYAAIEAYRADHKDVPNWFSDLVPDYLPDVNMLVCPECLRTGQIEGPPLADPRIASSYLFEFCPVPLGTLAPANPKATRREWKQRQMGVVGSIVPIVRCRHHHGALNLAFDGRIFTSASTWETVLTNIVDPATLTPARMFPALKTAKKSYPARDPNTALQMLDLTAFYNARLTDSWHGTNGATGNDLGSLSPGVQNLGGIEFDVRGVAQLGSKAPTANRFPTNLTAIKVKQKCQKIHFLHAAAFGHAGDEGKTIGTYVLHFASNQMRLDVPVVYGNDVRDWHYWSGEKPGPESLNMVWKGENKTTRNAGSYIRLFETTWTNLVPNVELESIDFVSSMSQPAPFLLAITLE